MMNIKQVIIVGTMAFVITLGPSLSGYLSGTDTALNQPKQTDLSNDTKENGIDPLVEALGLTDEEAVYEELLEGHSLADIAEANHKDVSQIIELQVSQLQEQLLIRFSEGNLTQEQYEQQVNELPDIITDSVHRQYALS